MSGTVRTSPFAGTWYPGEPAELSRLVRELLEREAPAALGEDVLALVAPHAGLAYSGPVAAAAYRLLEGAPFDAAVLIGPSHRAFFDALAVYPRGAFETPLGSVEVDEELAAVFVGAVPEARAMLDVHAREHCLEMQLPFLQTVLPDCRIVPVMMGNQSARQIAAAATALERIGASGRAAVLVASSDLSHYEARPRARELDGVVLDSLEAFDPAALRDALDANPDHACGGGPMVSVMTAARAAGATAARVLRYGDSGDASGDVDAVVGYVAAAFYRAREAA